MGDMFESDVLKKAKMNSYGTIKSTNNNKHTASSNSSFDHSKYVNWRSYGHFIPFLHIGMLMYILLFFYYYLKTTCC